MYAIIETGGKQYRVEKDDIIDVELLQAEKGQIVEFTQVLFFNDGKDVKVGAPYVDQSVVRAELLMEAKGPKEIAFKYKQRKGIRRKVGHRQKYHRIKITEIVG
ncbi:50S ribosomal protein L21 [Rhabdochlamydiaceae symbiont of Dictyostelium giganteum]|uniref:50S ribosomal protein L21 n=1 Tax=Rhabdochlamydiaceae symbiont of Dictyostelium giganteum TaxID=3342349 RepID=UPI00384ECDE4